MWGLFYLEYSFLIRTVLETDYIYPAHIKQKMPRTTIKMTARELKLDNSRRIAWRKYFKGRHENFQQQVEFYDRLEGLRDALANAQEQYNIPPHFQNKFKELLEQAKSSIACPVCLDVIDPEQLDITNCGHCYCKPCKARLDKCAICRRTF